MRKLLLSALVLVVLGGCAARAKEAYTSYFSSAYLEQVPIEVLDSAWKKTSKIRTKNDGKKDHWQTPSETERIGTGDCEDLAFYFERIVENAGYECRVVFGKESIKDEIYHAWVEANLKGEVMIYDPAMYTIKRKSEVETYEYVEFAGKFVDELSKYRNRASSN